MPARAARAQKPAIRSGPYTRVARGVPERLERPHQRLAVGHRQCRAERCRARLGVLAGGHHQVHGRRRHISARARGDRRVHPVHHLLVVGHRQRDAQDLRGGRRRRGRGWERGRRSREDTGAAPARHAVLSRPTRPCGRQRYSVPLSRMRRCRGSCPAQLVPHSCGFDLRRIRPPGASASASRRRTSPCARAHTNRPCTASMPVGRDSADSEVALAPSRSRCTRLRASGTPTPQQSSRLEQTRALQREQEPLGQVQVLEHRAHGRSRRSRAIGQSGHASWQHGAQRRCPPSWRTAATLIQASQVRRAPAADMQANRSEAAALRRAPARDRPPRLGVDQRTGQARHPAGGRTTRSARRPVSAAVRDTGRGAAGV